MLGETGKRILKWIFWNPPEAVINKKTLSFFSRFRALSDLVSVFFLFNPRTRLYTLYNSILKNTYRAIRIIWIVSLSGKSRTTCGFVALSHWGLHTLQLHYKIQICANNFRNPEKHDVNRYFASSPHDVSSQQLSAAAFILIGHIWKIKNLIYVGSKIKDGSRLLFSLTFKKTKDHFKNYIRMSPSDFNFSLLLDLKFSEWKLCFKILF